MIGSGAYGQGGDGSRLEERHVISHKLGEE